MATIRPQVDPDVKLPPSVIAASKRADEIMQARSAPPAATPESKLPTPPAAPAAATPAPAPPPAPVPATAPPPAPAPAPAAQADPAAKVPDWEANYKAMKGRFDQQENANRQLTGQITDLQRLLATISTPAPAAPVAPEIPEEYRLTDKERTEYGEDFLRVVEKKAREISAAENAELKATVARLEQRMGNVSNAMVGDARQKMFDTLSSNVANWRELNTSPEFLAWLALPDPYSGATRRTLLTKAYNENSASRLEAFFRGFIAEQAATGPDDAPVYSGANPPPKVDLGTLAAPGRAKQATANPSSLPEKPFYRRADIARFYTDIRKGAFAGRDADRLATEQDIIAAGREGRIRG